MRTSSEVNLLIVLGKFDPDRIDRASGVLQDATAAVELHPMFLLASELALAAESFLQKPDTYARNCGLTEEQVAAVLEIDAASLRFAANSFERKRKSR